MNPDQLTRLQHLTEGGDAGACCDLLRHYTRAGDVEAVGKWGRLWLSLESTAGQAAERRQVGFILAGVVKGSGWEGNGGASWNTHWIMGPEDGAPRVALLTPSMADMEALLRACLSRCIRQVFSYSVAGLLMRAFHDFGSGEQELLWAGFSRVTRLVNTPDSLRATDVWHIPTFRVPDLRGGLMIVRGASPEDFEARRRAAELLIDLWTQLNHVCDGWNQTHVMPTKESAEPLELRYDGMYVAGRPIWQVEQEQRQKAKRFLETDLDRMRTIMSTLGSYVVEWRQTFDGRGKHATLRGGINSGEYGERAVQIANAEVASQQTDQRAVLFGVGSVVVEEAVNPVGSPPEPGFGAPERSIWDEDELAARYGRRPVRRRAPGLDKGVL